MFAFSEEQNLKTIFTHCVVSFFYSTAIFMYLLLSDHKYSIGKLSSIPIAAVFVSLECAKYLIQLYAFPVTDESLGRQNERASSGVKRQYFKNKFREVLKCVIYFGISVFVLFVTFIIFGAEVFHKHEETLMLSVLLAVLTLIHAYINLGSQAVVNIVLGLRPCSTGGKMVYRNIIGAILGTWFGAFFIPLDWDRPWQEWPITCALGGISGFGVSNFITAVESLYQHSKREKSGRKFL